MTKIKDLRICRQCGNVFSRLVGERLIFSCPQCGSDFTPSELEL